MKKKELEKFIVDHLYNELRWLLCATASWAKAKQTYTKGGPTHFIVYTMDSAFLHARSLFEFFTYTNDKKSKEKGLVIWKDFGLKEGLKSDIYTTWMPSLHHYVMHLKSRLTVNNVIDGKHLKNMVLDFSIEIVRRWIELSNKIDRSLKAEMDNVLEISIKEAEGIWPPIRDKIDKKLRVK